MTKKIKFPLVLNVSGWKGEIAWETVHPRPDLVLCQASSGSQEWDDLFPTYWKKLKSIQVKKGAYHVFDSEKDPYWQAENYLDAVDQAGGFDGNSISPILNLSKFEHKSSWRPPEKKIRQFLDKVQNDVGETPIIHVSREGWKSLKDRRGHYPDWTNDYFLWMAWLPPDPDIYKQPPANTFPKGWEDWAIWEYDQAATISGIKGYVSLSTLSDEFATQIGLDIENQVLPNLQQSKFNFNAVITSESGAIIRRHTHMNSKMLAFLAQGTPLNGEIVEFVNNREAWLYITKPVVGWCPIVHTGKVYLSVDRTVFQPFEDKPFNTVSPSL